MPETHKNGNVSDAQLDALLAEWAEAEIEPPAGFHEQTMKRLRAEVQPAKKNNVISLFAKNRRWTSIAAAAVLMLFCVPVVQGQLGGDVTGKVPDAEVQMEQNADISLAQAGAAVNVDNDMADTKEESPAAKKAVRNGAVVPDAVQNTGETGLAAASVTAEEAQPMVAAYSPETEIANMQGRMAAYSDVEEEATLEQLQQALAELEAQLAGYQEKLAESPEDTSLQELVAETQKAIEELNAKIEDRKTQINEQQAE